MTTVFIFKGRYGHGEESHKLIRECAELFCARRELTRASFEIKTDDRGKPYFVDADGDDHIEFSVSNSGDHWMLAVSTEPCGIDVQTAGDNDLDAIAKRWFKLGELLYIERTGEDGFYRIWVRREAYGKMTGEGFFGKIPPLADENGYLFDDIADPETGRTFIFADIEIPGADEKAYCSLCSADKPQDVRVVELDS